MTQFRWGIIGTGAVAHKFALALAETRGATLALVASRDAGKAAGFAAAYGNPRAVGSYEAAAAAPDIDAFYIATPPSEHRANALLCIAAGRPVLIEKPLAANADDAAAIADAARAAGVFAMEGMWTRFMPAIAEARRLIDTGAIGEVRQAAGSFGIATRVDPGASLFDARLGGGALLHRGVYPLSLALALLGPAQLAGSAVQRGQTGVDDDVAAILRHDGGAITSLRASLRSNDANDFCVLGTQGRLRLQGPIYRPSGVIIERFDARGGSIAPRSRLARLKETGLVQGLWQRASASPLTGLRGQGRQVAARFAGNGYVHEIEAVMASVAAGETETVLMPLDASVAILRLCDRILAA